MRALFAITFLMGVVSSSGAEDKKKDIDRLQGEWELERMEAGGKALPLDKINDKKYTLKGDELIPVETPKDVGKLTLDSTKKPAQIDLTDRDKQTMHGIYRIQDDKWEICFAAPGEARPTEFKTTAENKAYLMVLRRKSK